MNHHWKKNSTRSIMDMDSRQSGSKIKQTIANDRSDIK
jgi:hypothetical protein